MSIDRRSLIGISAGGVTGSLMPSIGRATPAPLGSLGLDITHFGVRPGSPDDQSETLQRAIEAAAAARVPLWLPAGTYIAADLVLPSGAQLYGIRGATRFVLSAGSCIVGASQADQITLQGIVFDGMGTPLPDRRGLVTLRQARGVRISDCFVQESGGIGISLDTVSGEISGNTVLGAAEAAIFSIDARGLLIARNEILNPANNGILVWRSETGDDGTQVIGNRIEQVRAANGGSGQNGNGINVFRAGNVTVADNRIRNCTFSAVRGNAASNLHIRGNSASGLGEVALYAEFGFEGAVISGNSVQGAATGVSITNFDRGGRLAVCQGNLIRDVRTKGIFVEADASVSGNVVENAADVGIMAGWGKFLRDVNIAGNVVRNAPIGIGVSVVSGTGAALIANNVIAGATTGAIIGMDHDKPVTKDLALEGTTRFAQVTVVSNQAS